MIHGKIWEMHDDATIAKYDATAMRLLTAGGARIENEEILNLLEAGGCRIERSAQRCYFSEKLVRDAVAHLSGNKRPLDVTIDAGWKAPWQITHTGSLPHYLDWPSGKRRLATQQDILDMAKMAHTLDEFTNVGKVLTCSDVDQRIEPLWTSLQIAKITNKPPASGEVFFPNYLDDLVAMGEILTGKQGSTVLFPDCDFFIQPLILERNQAACFLKKRQLGMAISPGTMAVSGMSSPVTVAGTVALSLAELLAGWTIGYVINPSLWAGGVVATGSIDMRTMSACFGSPEANLQNIATTNAAMRLYGIHPWPVSSYTDCKTPGLTAAFNKMFGLLYAPFSHSRNIGNDGLLSAGQDYSPVQQILDIEMGKAIERFWGHFDVTDDTLAADLILEQMAGTSTNFLTTDHTMMHWQGEQWYPRWLDRTLWQNPQFETAAEMDMMRRIDAYCKDAIARYEPPQHDPVRIRELERIYAAAEKRLLV